MSDGLDIPFLFVDLLLIKAITSIQTTLSHRFGRVRDWVLIYFETDSVIERRRTIVTDKKGPLKEHRIARGREKNARNTTKHSS